MIDLLIEGGTVVDGSGRFPASVAVDGGRIAALLAPSAEAPEARSHLEVRGCEILPGLVDPHVHFYGEGIGEFSRLAAIGGVTTFIGMVRGAPDEPLDNVVARYRDEGMAKSLVDFSFHVVLYEREGILAEIGPLAMEGMRSYKTFLAYRRRGMMVSERFLLEAMAEVRRHAGVVLVHCEDGDVIDFLERRAHDEGRRNPASYEPSRPPESEAVSVALACLCAQATGCPLYVVHLSSVAGLCAIEEARHRGACVWVETCPQYLLMDDSTLLEHGPIAKIAPPLRRPADRRALGAALATGAVNTVGSDHASHALSDKRDGANDIFAAPFGMPGSPTLWPSMYTWADEHRVPLPVLVRAMAQTPARLFGLGARKGHLRPGADADLVVIDPTQSRLVDAAALWPGTAPSPLAGRRLKGWPKLTLSRGEVIWADGEFRAAPGRAQFIKQGEYVPCELP